MYTHGTEDRRTHSSGLLLESNVLTDQGLGILLSHGKN